MIEIGGKKNLETTESGNLKMTIIQKKVLMTKNMVA